MSYVKKKAFKINRIQKILAGENEDDIATQQSEVNKTPPNKVKNEICKKAGLKRRVFVGKKVGLALQKKLAMSNRQMRKQRRFMRNVNVLFEGEEKQTKLIRKLVPSDPFPITNKKNHFTDKHNQPFTEDIPMLYVIDLIKLTNSIFQMVTKRMAQGYSCL